MVLDRSFCVFEAKLWGILPKHASFVPFLFHSGTKTRCGKLFSCNKMGFTRSLFHPWNMVIIRKLISGQDITVKCFEAGLAFAADVFCAVRVSGLQYSGYEFHPKTCCHGFAEELGCEAGKGFTRLEGTLRMRS